MEEIETLSSQIDNYHSTLQTASGEKRTVTFSDEFPQLAATDFLGCFECHLAREDRSAEGAAGGEKGVSMLQTRVKTSIPEARYSRLGKGCSRKKCKGGERIIGWKPMYSWDLLPQSP